jgi:hypothetical protein
MSLGPDTTEKPMAKMIDEEAEKVHRIRITLTSLNVENLEKRKSSGCTCERGWNV